MLVDFMLIGAQKSGTTSLAHQLAQHPQISFCRHKEPDYFCKKTEWARKIDEYHRLYEISPGMIYGEGSTTYTMIPEYTDTARRIYDYNPNLKLLYIMRQPVERAISNYTHNLLRARIRYPKEIEIFENPTYVNYSRYALQMRPYLELFPRGNLHLILFEEYIARPLESLHAIAAFLGIEPSGFDEIDLSPQHQTSDRTADKKIKKWLTPLAKFFPAKIRCALRGPFVYRQEEKVVFQLETKKLLWRFLQDDVRAMEELMERRLDIWRYFPYDW